MTPLTLLFGLDGATFTVLDDLMAAGVMPNLAEFVRTGTRAVLKSVTPPLTPPAWTTLATGREPGQHGVFGFFQSDADDPRKIQLVSSRHIKTETLWRMVNSQGRRAGVLNFIAHHPPPAIDGWVVPGWVTARWLRVFSHPAGLVDRLKSELPGFDGRALAMDFQEETKSIAGMPITDCRAWVDLHIEREKHWFNLLWHMLETDRVDLAAVVFDGVDKLQHALWEYLDPESPSVAKEAEFHEIRAIAREYFQALDQLLGETMQRAGEGSSIFVCSDHGFTGSRELVYINTWLEQQGYLTWRPDCEFGEESTDLNPTPYQLNAFDLSATQAYAIIPSSNGIHIPVRRGDNSTGIAPEEYEPFRRRLTDELLSKCLDPHSGEPLITHVWPREEIFAGPQLRNAPDLTLQLRDHGFISVRPSKSVYVKRANVFGTHHPDGVFVARGPGIRCGALIDPVRLLDIAPTVLHAMGLEIPSDLSGRAVTEIYESPRPVRIAAGPAVAASSTPTGESVDADDEVIIERLKVLGYID